jgi:hypothetical protein
MLTLLLALFVPIPRPELEALPAAPSSGRAVHGKVTLLLALRMDDAE